MQEEENVTFYEVLQLKLNHQMFDHLTIGDFNAKVTQHQHQSWPSVVGRYGIGQENDRGNTWQQFCAINQLTLSNTLYTNKPEESHMDLNE